MSHGREDGAHPGLGTRSGAVLDPPSVLRQPSPGAWTGEVALISTCELRSGLSPRSSALDSRHVAALMESLDYLPPIIVEQRSNMVIDGLHRLEAFRRSGRDRIPARMYTGPKAEAFVLAVQANTTHGMPLTLADRRRSARRILTDFPSRSDRWIGHATGLSHSTVAKLREELGDTATSDVRVGADERRRNGRSVGRRSQAPAALKAFKPEQPALDRLAPDPAMSSGAMSVFLTWLKSTAIREEEWSEFLGNIPVGRLYEVADECRNRAKSWSVFASAVEARASARR